MFQTLGQDGDRAVGVIKARPLALVETPELLQDLGVVRIRLQDPIVGVFRSVKLWAY
jgi:hypothetical protein